MARVKKKAKKKRKGRVLFSDEIPYMPAGALDLTVADEIFKKKTAVYFLYKKKQLYYVGKAKNALRRIQQHLTDEHAGNWNFFSVIMPRKSNHLADLERFAIMAGRPTSNKQRPRLSRKKASRQLIKKEIRKNRREASKLEKLMKETL